MFTQLTSPTTYDIPILADTKFVDIEIAHALDLSSVRHFALVVRMHDAANNVGANASITVECRAVWPCEGDPRRFQDDTGSSLATTTAITNAGGATGFIRRTSLAEVAWPFLRVYVRITASGGATASNSSVILSVGIVEFGN
jgi:hypothetical protein